MNIERFIGFICGVGVAVLLIWALTRRMNTDGSRKTEYDERQKAVRGVGYRYGYYTLMALVFILIGLDMLEVRLPMTNTVLYFTAAIISGMVLASYCIMHDAYWGINNNVRFYTRFFIGIGAINLIYGILEIVRGDMVVDGVLQNTFNRLSES